jgi:hypothetical protein
MQKEVIKQKISDLKAQSKEVSEGAKTLLTDIEATIKEVKELKEQTKAKK